MNKQLNIARIKDVMQERGLSQAKLAETLSLSRTTISNWLKEDKFPRPDKLLKLGMTLGLSLNQLVVQIPNPQTPMVSYRKKMNRTTRDEHFEKASDMGRLLNLLVDFYPFDNLVQPPTLKKPFSEYNYLQKVVTKIRKDIGIKNSDPVTPEQLIQKFVDLEVIIIPVLWGSKETHGNALRIYLPSSKTTWIYLNLDSNAHDFLFWMVHELGHVISPSLHNSTKESEDFADQFAQAFLFTKELAQKAYGEIIGQRTKGKKISIILSYAKKHIISPITIYRAINNYAEQHGKQTLKLDGSLYGATTNFNKEHQKVSELLCGSDPITAEKYITASEKKFKTPFFKILKKYLSETEKTAGFVQTILGATLLDAKEIHADLTQ